MPVKSIEVNIGVTGAEASRAKLDEITRRAETLKSAFPEYKLKIDSAAASEKLRLFKAELAGVAKDKTVNVKVKVDDSELAKLGKRMQGGGPGLLIGSAVALAPAAGTLAGVGAGAAIGLGGAAVAGGGALAAFAAVAKPVFTGAEKAALAVAKAQNAYNAAIAGGVKPAVAFKAEQLAIAKAYAGMSPAQIALSKQLGGMSDAWAKVKAAQTPVVAGALQPWLKSVTDLTGKLAPIIAHVSPVIKDLGTQFDALIRSPAFKGFRDFIASTGTAVVSAGGGALMDFLKGFMTLLPRFDPLIREAAAAVTRFGTAFAAWAGSKKAAAEIQGFLQWFSANGPVVGGLLKNIGGALKVLAPGLAAGGITELRVVSDFFGLIAKLPKGIAGPVAELAGALLILNKLGVVSVGLKLLGGGAGAAGLWAKLLPGVAMAGGALVATIVVKTLLDAASHGAGHDPWNRPFGADPKSADPAKQGVSTWVGLGHQIEHAFDAARHGIAAAFAGAGSWLTSAGAAIIHGLASGITSAWNTVTAWLAGSAARTRSQFAAAGSWLLSAGAAIIRGLLSGISSAWNAVTAWLGGIPATVRGYFSGAEKWLADVGGKIVSGLATGLEAAWSGVAGWFSGLPKKILSALGIKSPPGWAIDAGKHIMGGLLKGITHGATDIRGFFRSIAMDVSGPFKGIWSGLAAAGKDVWHFLFGGGGGGQAAKSNQANQSLGQQMAAAAGWTGGQWRALNSLIMGESGWNSTIMNAQGSGAAGIAQNIKGFGPGYEKGNAGQQISWLISYIRGRYGTPEHAYAFWLSQSPHWYDQGGWLMPGLTLAANNTGVPERILGPSERGGGDIHVHFHGLVTDPNATARKVVQVLKEYKRHGGGAALGIA